MTTHTQIPDLNIPKGKRYEVSEEFRNYLQSLLDSPEHQRQLAQDLKPLVLSVA